MITRPCYASRDEVMRSTDSKAGLLSVERVDRALASAADAVEGGLRRRFYPEDATRFVPWPNYQFAYPWRWWSESETTDICALTQMLSPGNYDAGTGGVEIPLWQVFLETVNRKRGFPYTYIELDRSTNAAWGAAPTPQHSIWMTGTWGFTADADQVATLAADLDDSSATLTLDDGSGCGAGDVIILEYARGDAPYPLYLGTAGAVQPFTGERCIVQDKTAADTSLVQDTGCTTASNADQSLTWTGAGTLNAGEVLILDSERMLVLDVVNSVATVSRGWDGTTVTTHSGAEIYALRQLTVIRGELGTTAVSHSEAAAVYRHRVPDLVRDLSLALATDQVLQEVAGYSRTVAAGDAAVPATGAAIGIKWQACRARFGRKSRIGAV